MIVKRFSAASLVAAAVAVAMGAALAVPVAAQTIDFNDLMNRVGRLENTVSTLSQRLYQSEPGIGGGGGVALPPAQAGDLVVRVQRLERALQELTGRYEESTYGVAQVKDRLDRLASDLEYRLSQLENRSGGDPAAAQRPPGKPGPAPVANAVRPINPPPPSRPGAVPPPPPDEESDLGPTGGNSRTESPPPPPRNQTAALPPAKLPTGTEQTQYDYAFGLLREADYEHAEQALSSFVKQHKDSPLAGNAQYWLAETYYARAKYKEAAVAFAEGFQKYPKSGKAADNLLKLGMSLAQLNQTKDACVAFGQLANQFPDASNNLKQRAQQERAKLKCS